MKNADGPIGRETGSPPRLAVGPDTLDVPAGSIVAVCGATGSGAEQLAAQARSALIAPRWGAVGRRSGPTAQDADIALISVRSTLAPRIDVTENIFLNRLRTRRLGPVPVGLDWAGMRRDAAAALQQVGSAAAVTTLARDLAELDAVLVELARVAAHPVALLVVEEPTALLRGGSGVELDRVIAALDGFRARGTAVVVLTQKPRQALGYADAVAVARDGRLVARHERADWDAEGAESVRRRILGELVGPDAPLAPAEGAAEPGGIPATGSTSTAGPDAESPRPAPAGRELLRIERWSALDLLPPNQPVVRDVTLALAEGEILGLTGLERSGAETLLLSVYGRSAGVDATGRVLVRGTEVDTSTVQKSIEAGLFLTTADPPRYQLSVVGGISVPVAGGRMRGFAAAGMIDERPDEGGLGGKLLDAVRSTGREGDTPTRIRGLVREFAASERLVLMLGEPTRGAKPAAHAEIVAGLRSAAAAGKGVIVVSDDLDLLRELCHRVVAFSEGRVTGEVPAGAPPSALAELIAPD